MSPTSSPTRNQFDLHQRTPSSPNKATERPLKNVKIDPTQLNIAGIEEALRNEDAAFDLKWTQCEKYLLNCVLLLGGDLNDVNKRLMGYQISRCTLLKKIIRFLYRLYVMLQPLSER